MSCKKNDCTSAKYSYTFSENKKIDTIKVGGSLVSVQINPGTSIVFSYSLVAVSCPGRIDGGASERLIFKIPAGTTNFNYSSADIQGIQCYYENSPLGGLTKVTQGTLKGNKISDNKWDIDVNLDMTNRGSTLSFTHQFSLE
jgi:hypothetical protein